MGCRRELVEKTDIAFAISNECGRLITNVIIHYNSAILSKLYQKYEQVNNKNQSINEPKQESILSTAVISAQSITNVLMMYDHA